jgi:hypothetical protein
MHCKASALFEPPMALKREKIQEIKKVSQRTGTQKLKVWEKVKQLYLLVRLNTVIGWECTSNDDVH